MNHFDENVFESIESAHEYLQLLSEVVKATFGDPGIVGTMYLGKKAQVETRVVELLCCL
jgi:hypothetical protein